MDMSVADPVPMPVDFVGVFVDAEEDLCSHSNGTQAFFADDQRFPRDAENLPPTCFSHAACSAGNDPPHPGECALGNVPECSAVADETEAEFSGNLSQAVGSLQADGEPG
jgi:hypothetical protein